MGLKRFGDRKREAGKVCVAEPLRAVANNADPAEDTNTVF